VTISRSDQRYLDKLQRDTFQYFWKEADPRSGLVPDNTSKGAPSSIAAVGLALATYAVGVERHCISRKQGIERTLATLRFFAESSQGPQADATRGDGPGPVSSAACSRSRSWSVSAAGARGGSSAR
jgi:hypothetical protein